MLVLCGAFFFNGTPTVTAVEAPKFDYAKETGSLLDVALSAPSSNGANNASIPIVVPEGRAGLTPNLQLTYNSNGRNGWLGVGWDLDLGSIQRNTKRGVSYTAKDFVVTGNDGNQELVAHSSWGTNYYGTRVENAFTKYYYNGTTWVASATDGKKYYYGSSTNSQELVSGKTFQWHLDKIEDANGNYIAITYQANSGTLYPSTIVYAKNDARPTLAVSKVIFSLEDRTDVSTSYVASSRLAIAKRLKTIMVYGKNSALSRKYELTYNVSANTGRSMLREALVYGSDGVTKLPAISFTPQVGAKTVSEAWSQTRSTSAYTSNNESFQMADVNGDGRTDFVYDSNGTIKVKLSQGNSFIEVVWGTRSASYTPEMDIFQLADVNGDGMADFIYDANGSIRVLLGKANLATSQSTNVVWGSRGASYYYFNVSTASPSAGTAKYYPPFQVGDVNGDGKSDFVFCSTDNSYKNVYVQFSSGTGFGSKVKWGERLGLRIANHALFLYGGNEKRNTINIFQLADVNGDGRADLIYEKDATNIQVIPGADQVALPKNSTSWGGHKAHYSLNAWTSCWHYGIDTYYPFTTDVGFKMADVNGDGLADFIYQAVDGLNVMLSSSNGFLPSQIWNSSVLSYLQTSFGDLSICRSGGCKPSAIQDCPKPFFYLLPLQLADVNGDGMADIVYNSAGRTMKVLLSTGTTFMNQYTWGTRAADYFDKIKYFALADVNGNGLPDLVYDDGAKARVMQVSGGANAIFPDLLASITTGLGGRYRFTYKPSSLYDNQVTVAGKANYLPFVLNTLATVTSDYGYTSLYAGTSYASLAAQNSVTSYSYSGGYYDAGSREFRGFNTVTATNPDLSVATTEYQQDDYCKGRPTRTELRTANQQTLLSSTVFTWKNALAGSTEYDCGVRDDTSGWGFVLLKQKTQTTDGLTTTENSTYHSETGLPSTVVTSGTGAETITKTNTYVKKGTSTFPWIWRLAAENTTGATSGKRRETTSAYDAMGNPTSQTSVNTGGVNNVTVKYQDYDLGLPQKTIDGRNLTTTTLYDPDFAARQDTVTYPLTANSIPHVERYDYDDRFGKISAIIDVNKQTTLYHYDVFGRLDRINYPDGGKTEYNYNCCSGVLPRKVEVKEYSTGTAYTARKEVYDGLGRLIQTNSNGQGGTTIITKTLYDAMGRVSYSQDPSVYTFTATDAPNYFAKGFPTTTGGRYPRTTITYDLLSRPLTVIKYITTAGAQASATTSYSYSPGGLTTITDPDSKKKREQKDHLDRLLKVTENYGNTAAHDTLYIYDAASDLVEINDQDGSKISHYTYDTLGRKKGMDDADLGIWSYNYDANGNLTSQTDANQQVVQFVYDPLNRVTKKTYVGQAAANTVNYTYDTALKGVGRAATVSSGSSTHTYVEYDKMGRLLKESRTIAPDPQIYTTCYAYDFLGRTVKIIYPDNYLASYLYYSGTDLLNAVTGPGGAKIADFANYDAFGRPGLVTLANGVATDTVYDSRSAQVTSIRSRKGTSVRQHKSYSYFPSGDVESITNTMGGMKYTYVYDGLHRLTKETKTDLAGAQAATTASYTYYYNGNLKTKNEENGAKTLAYLYNNLDHIHATSDITVSGQTYSLGYDDNGNLTSGPDLTNPSAVATRTIFYTPAGKPKQVVSTVGGGSLTTDFAYDGDGFRVKQSTGAANTIYVSDAYEVNNGIPAKYIFANQARIAKINPSGTYYFLQDHLGSTTVVTDASGTAVAGESAEYKPFGGFRTAIEPSVSSYRFTDQEFDGKTKLYYYDARNYDPAIGRFISADTVTPDYTDPQSLNRYSYTRNNPLVYVDPTGHWSFSFDVGGTSWGWNSEWVDWDATVDAGLGLTGNALGMFVGNAMIVIPSPMITQITGATVLAKSAYGWGANWYNLTQALKGDEDNYGIQPSATRFCASLFSSNRDAILFADAADLGIDLFSGRAMFRYPYGAPTIEGVRGFTQSWDPVKQTFTHSNQINAFQLFEVGRTMYNGLWQ